MQGMAETLPKDRVIVEILETAEPTPLLLSTVKSSMPTAFALRWMILNWARPRNAFFTLCQHY